ncbi:hypothetical protein JN086_15405 [Mycolicibacterium austroafricanum]|jgi:hypothetical protein|nr:MULTISPECIES: hypothetical protein [Mycolicibacterium]ABM13835.1 conserved hypothetical protein [Mycolicibacterium vanbaalenii PYR-1]MDN4518826.1 hypothetical protein [Mycolicibacterium austroafricanum]PQP46164.1 hypothetical protein C6A88_18650 [Mycolicibacterium austroafricanum]QRZ09580.1 hypothetical protein JN090_14440 [Mycolicibacterium austroafricanum]QZT65993.1 hypothetical protein JN086_15405 [Mycolicibacterium austroafricanum]
MLRTFAVLAATASLLAPTVAVGGAGSAGAQPAPTEPAPAACTFELTAPSVVNVSGTNVVTATVTTRACDGAVAYRTTACIQMQGASGPGQCAHGNGINPAQVFFQPYRPGANYTSTGRGCASKGNPPQPYCQENGPFSATL